MCYLHVHNSIFYLELILILMVASFLSLTVMRSIWPCRVDMTCIQLVEIFFIVFHCVDDRGRTMTFGSGCTPPVDGVLIKILSLYCIGEPIRTDLF